MVEPVCGVIGLLLDGGAQSALEPAGQAAEQIHALWIGMAVGAGVIWALMVALTVHAIDSKRGRYSERLGNWLIVGGGVVFPTVTLAGLLAYGLALLPELLAPAPEGSAKVLITGEQWWWRVTYLLPDGQRVEAANELRLAVGEPVELRLTSSDVIHSFWVPTLGGKMDMFPGRTTRLVLRPTRTGTFRGVCAEYCGSAHALMALDVVVLEREALAHWIEEQRRPARPDGSGTFLASGCAACHAIRGTPARGVIGPDLTHVGSRPSLAAATLSNDVGTLFRWITDSERIKPGVHMPAFGMLPEQERRALADYLAGLE